MKGCANCNKTTDICPEKTQENIDVAAWIRFVRDLGLPKIFSTLPDQRKKSQITYSISSIAMWAFSTCAFRHGSKNAMQTDLDALPKRQLESMLNLLEIEGKTVPHSSPVDEALSKIEFEKFNDICVFRRFALREQTILRLCDELKIGYLIVFKDTVLPTLVKKCDELEKTGIYQKNYANRETVHEKNKVKQREARWFNKVAAGEDVFTNVLRFKEETKNPDGSLETSYKGAWLYSKSVFGHNCFKIASRARGRWDHEDLHNTCKNREFDIKHDLARTDPNLLLVWKMMVFIAFFVFELFKCTTIAIKARKRRSLMGFAQSLLSDLLKIYWSVIAASPILQKPRVQFRFSFSCGP